MQLKKCESFEFEVWTTWRGRAVFVVMVTGRLMGKCFSLSTAGSGGPTIIKLENAICPFWDITGNKLIQPKQACFLSTHWLWSWRVLRVKKYSFWKRGTSGWYSHSEAICVKAGMKLDWAGLNCWLKLGGFVSHNVVLLQCYTLSLFSSSFFFLGLKRIEENVIHCPLSLFFLAKFQKYEFLLISSSFAKGLVG